MKGQTFPMIARIGILAMLFGILFDLVEHTLVFRVSPASGFPVEEHLAHLIVLVGMVLILVGIVRDGIRTQRREPRQKWSARRALR